MHILLFISQFLLPNPPAILPPKYAGCNTVPRAKGTSKRAEVHQADPHAGLFVGNPVVASSSAARSDRILNNIRTGLDPASVRNTCANREGGRPTSFATSATDKERCKLASMKRSAVADSRIDDAEIFFLIRRVGGWRGQRTFIRAVGEARPTPRCISVNNLVK
jgi:hypothetical protein